MRWISRLRNVPHEVDVSGNDHSSRLNFIDGLRGVAIAMVVLRHYYLGVYTPGLPRIADLMTLGYLGVHLFLLLSGFCVAWAYIGPRARPFKLHDFALRRATRILPAYYVALAIFIVAALPMQRDEFIWQTLTHVTMTHNFFSSTVLALNGPFWSIALESQLYVIFPLLFLSYKRFGIVKVLACIFVFQMTFRYLVAWRFGTGYDELTFVLPFSVAGRLLEFALGLLAALLISSHAHTERFRSWGRVFPVFALLCFAAAYTAKHTLGITAPLTDLFWTLGFFWLLLAGSVPQSLLNRVLSWQPIVGLGVISYSVYLMHQFFLEPTANYVRQSVTQPWLVLALMLPVIAVTIGLCYGFYRLVEKPSQRYFAHRRKARKSVPAAPIDVSPAQV